MKCIMEHNYRSTIPLLMHFKNHTKSTEEIKMFNLIQNYRIIIKFSSSTNDFYSDPNSFLFVEFISKHLQSYGRFSFYWIYNLDIWFYSNNFWKNLDVHLPSSFAQCKLANTQIRFEYVWNHIFQCPLNVVEIFYGVFWSTT